MIAQWGIAALALGLAVLVAVVTGAAHRRTARSLASARAEVAALRDRVDALERPAPESVAHPRAAEHVITVLGEDPAPGREPDTERTPVPGPLFADLVLREGVVQVAALAAGVRRALAPEQRHRVRLEMRREVKRARKQRRSDVRDARRVLADRARREPAA